jgi:hypothetical protein
MIPKLHIPDVEANQMDNEMQNDFHFKFFGFEVRAIGPLAIFAAVIAIVLIFSPARAVLF